MTEMHTIARLLAAIKASENSPVFDVNYIDEKVIKDDAKSRDRIALMLQKEGLIEGLYVIDGIDNMEMPYIKWDASHPHLTLKGMEYMSENKAINKVYAEIKDVGVSIASQTINNFISGFLK